MSLVFSSNRLVLIRQMKYVQDFKRQVEGITHGFLAYSTQYSYYLVLVNTVE